MPIDLQKYNIFHSVVSTFILYYFECLILFYLKYKTFKQFFLTDHDTSYLLQNKKPKLKKPKSRNVIVTSQNNIMTSQSEELGTLAFESDLSGESVHVQAVLASKTPHIYKVGCK